MTPEMFVNNYNLHDSIIDSIAIKNNGALIRMVLDFAFWMQEEYNEEYPETGSLIVFFNDVTEYDCPEQLSPGELSILKVSVQDNSVVFALLNDLTNEYCEIRVKAKEVFVDSINDDYCRDDFLFTDLIKKMRDK